MTTFDLVWFCFAFWEIAQERDYCIWNMDGIAWAYSPQRQYLTKYNRAVILVLIYVLELKLGVVTWLHQSEQIFISWSAKPPASILCWLDIRDYRWYKKRHSLRIHNWIVSMISGMPLLQLWQAIPSSILHNLPDEFDRERICGIKLAKAETWQWGRSPASAWYPAISRCLLLTVFAS